MLATLFDFPVGGTSQADPLVGRHHGRRPRAGIVDSEDQRRAELLECLAYFTELWNQRVNQHRAGQ
jgi:hypothetical protein